MSKTKREQARMELTDTQKHDARHNPSIEIIGQKGNRFEVIRSDDKKTIISIPSKEDDE